MTTADVRDDRLAWLAIRDDLDRRSRRNPLAALLTVTGNTGGGDPLGNRWSEIRTTRMALYWSAVTDVTERLNEAERRTLRRTGAVPGWFLAAVLRRYAQLQRGT